MYKLHISERALEDLEDIWEYSKNQFSKNQADSYLETLFTAFVTITKAPLQNKEYSKLERAYRAYKVKSHLVFYLVSDLQIVEIIRILHKSMDVDNRL